MHLSESILIVMISKHCIGATKIMIIVTVRVKTLPCPRSQAAVYPLTLKPETSTLHIQMSATSLRDHCTSRGRCGLFSLFTVVGGNPGRALGNAFYLQSA